MASKNTFLQLALALLVCNYTKAYPYQQPGYFSKDWYRCNGLSCSEAREVEDILIRIGGGSQTILNDGRHSSFPEKHNEEAMDVLFTKEQALDLLHSYQENENRTGHPRRVKRKVASFLKNPEQKWDLPIIYKFDDSHTYEEKEIIRSAFNHWMDNTCLMFFEVNREAHLDMTHLVVTNNDPGRCSSFIGKVMTNNKPQQINLGSSCLTKFGTPVHEIGHALGLWHEHQRGDRKDYIDILSKNIGWWAKANFVSAPDGYLEYYDIPYDYNSVMHYGPLTGTMFGHRTIQAKDELFQFNMGQRVSLSFLDSKAINRAYCRKRCRQRLSQNCRHGGYQDPLKCSQCRCPIGLSGKYCQHLALSNGVCGGTVYLDSHQNRIITSPGYTENRNYPDNVKCNWLVKAPPQHTVILRFEDEFSIHCSDKTCHHWVEVNPGPNFGIPGPRFCCSNTPDIRLESFDDELLITMRSNFSSNDTNRRGFKAIVTAVPPPGGADSPNRNSVTSGVNMRSKRGHTTTMTMPTSTSTKASTKTSTPKTTTRKPTGTTTKATTTTTEPTTTTTKSTTTTRWPTTTKTTSTSTTTLPKPVLHKKTVFTWSEWTRCFQHDCRCGGCSVQIRERLCNKQRCPPIMAMSQTRSCNRLCTAEDTKLYFAGRIFIFQCPECCPGYHKEGEKCIVNTY